MKENDKKFGRKKKSNPPLTKKNGLDHNIFHANAGNLYADHIGVKSGIYINLTWGIGDIGV